MILQNGFALTLDDKSLEIIEAVYAVTLHSASLNPPRVSADLDPDYICWMNQSRIPMRRMRILPIE